jgi:EAL domain-containing protein (putative c-di-GMP-specific phosphodiesterase class I)/DNA-binding SARP family transcriptional activator
VLTDVRRFIADNGLDPATMLTTAHRGYQLQLPATVTVDVDIAREALSAARTMLAEGAAAAAAERAAEASSLARLPFLPNHEGEWVDGLRHELATINARAVEIQARSHAQSGEGAAAAAAAEQLVHLEPFNEAAHQLRIRILAEAGDRSGAIKAYEHCREVLDAELGVEPSEETVGVYTAAMRSQGVGSPRAPAEGLAGMTTLVVEDHDFQRRTAAMLLRNLGVGTVLEAPGGAAALELLVASAPVDVIVCDVDMPGMDGIEFIRHVSEGELAGAVVIASALDAKVVQAVRAVGEGYGLQVLGAIEKPLTARRLGELLTTYRPQRRPSSSHGPGSAHGITVTPQEAKAALEEGRIFFHLQPAVDVATGQLAAVDAVPRWQHLTRGWVPPSVFMPLLEREGLATQLSSRAIDHACAHLVGCAEAGLRVTASIDLMADDLHDQQLPDRAAAVVGGAGLEPGSVTFELDERTFHNAAGAALSLFTRLRVKGFGVALDGFGAGRASIEQLRAVPLTELKLAPSLITGAGTDSRRVAALEEAVELARQLDVVIIGDGCDSDDDLSVLLEVGCDRVQGAFIGDAMPRDALLAWAGSWDPFLLELGGRQ